MATVIPAIVFERLLQSFGVAGASALADTLVKTVSAHVEEHRTKRQQEKEEHDPTEQTPAS
jgi:hypothetical protein